MLSHSVYRAALCLLLLGSLPREGRCQETFRFTETFENDTLDAGWSVSTRYAFANPGATPFRSMGVLACEYTIEDRKLTFSDNRPATAPDGSREGAIIPARTGYGHIFFTRTLPRELDDFRLSFRLGWDNHAGVEGTRQAMPIAVVTLLGGGGEIIARAGLYDGWASGLGRRWMQIGDATPPVREEDRLPEVSMEPPEIVIERSAGKVRILWEGEAAEADATNPHGVKRVQIDIACYRSDTEITKLGEVDFHALTLTGTPRPVIPAAP